MKYSVILLTFVFLVMIFSGCSNTASPTFSDNSNDGISNIQFLASEKLCTINGSRPIAVTKDNRTLFLNISEDVGNYIWISSPDNTTCENIIYKSKGKQICDPLLTDNWLIFIESSHDMIKSDWVIWAYQINSGSIYSVAESHPQLPKITTATPTLLGPLITADENILVWSGFEFDSNAQPVAVIKKCELTERSTETIDQKPTSEGEYGQPWLNKNWLVYDSGKVNLQTQTRDSAIILVDLNEVTNKLVVDSGPQRVNPLINNEYIFWKSNDSTIKYCKRDNINDISTIPHDRTGVWNLSCLDNFITWNENSGKISVYSISEEKTMDIKNQNVSSGGNFSANVLWWYINNANIPTAEWIVMKN